MTDVLQVPAEVAAGVSGLWPERGPAWTQHVLPEFEALCARYEATPQRVLPARYGFVAAVTTAKGPLVMRSTADPAGPVQAQFATRLAELNAAPAVHEVITTATGTWTVMDQVIPGHRVTEPSADTAGRLVALLRSIVGHPSPVPDAQRISDWLRDRLTDDNLTDTAESAPVAPKQERLHALDVLDALQEDEDAGLCHGDAHLYNVLIGEGGRLMMIDPRGMRGEVAYDVAVMALKAAPAVGIDAATVAAMLGEQVRVDPKRVCDWLTVAAAARV